MKTETIQMKLVPMKVGKYFEQIFVFMRVGKESEWYPSALLHIDAFWQGHHFENPNIASMLNAGEIVTINAHLEVIKNEE